MEYYPVAFYFCDESASGSLSSGLHYRMHRLPLESAFDLSLNYRKLGGFGRQQAINL